MPEPAIVRGSDHFFTTTYEGNGSGQRVGKFLPYTDNGTIAKSLTFENDTSDYLTRTQDTGDSKRQATFSWWFKRNTVSGSEMCHFAAAASSRLLVRFDTSNRLTFRLTNGTTEYTIVTNMTFRDTTKFFHCVWQIDVTQSTAANRSRVWIDGTEITSWSSASYPGQDTDVVGLGDGTTFRVGSLSHSATQFFDGEISEFNHCDGQIVAASEFGITDTSTGRWIPKSLSSITYGTNGFRLEFANSAGQTIGDDTSGNANDFTTNGFTYLVDPVLNSPSNLYATLDGGSSLGGTFRWSRRYLVTTNAGFHHYCSSFRPESGKWYAEFRYVASGAGTRPEVGVALSENFPYNGTTNRLLTSPVTDIIPGYAYYGYNGDLYRNSSNDTANTSLDTFTTQGDIVSIALDLDNKVVRFFNNGVSQGGYPLSHGRYCMFIGDGATGYDASWITNFGDNPTFCGGWFNGGSSNTVAAANTDGFGSTFKYTPPDGFKALMQDNLPELSPKGAAPKKPDLVWAKSRDSTFGGQVLDSSRGVGNRLLTSGNNAEAFDANHLRKFLNGGYETGNINVLNTAGDSMVAWNWVANGGTTSANTDGSGATIASTIQANQTAGFSIVQYTGNGTSGAKVAHGLSQAPEWIITKRLESSGSWHGYHSSQGATKYFVLNSTNAFGTSALTWNNTAPDATTFTLGSGNTNNNTGNFIAYCWHSVKGFSKIGKYRGNHNSNGPFVYTGFRPTWLLIKNVSDASQFRLFDGKRNTFNPVNISLRANTTTADATDNTYYLLDFLSNGFKIRGAASTDMNSSSHDYAYVAFAEHPFIGDGTNPATAK